jgi:mannose-6-phosphate isomerase-like protein (cupin superfamily)
MAPVTPISPRSSSSTTSHGAELTFETLSASDAVDARIRVRPEEQTLLRVIHGIVRLSIGGEDRLLGIGDEAIVPAAAPHRLMSACGETRIVMGFRAAPAR